MEGKLYILTAAMKKIMENKKEGNPCCLNGMEDSHLADKPQPLGSCSVVGRFLRKVKEVQSTRKKHT